MSKTISKIYRYKKVYEYELAMESEEWISKIPFIKFPDNWNIQIIPPTGGAIVRFLVKLDNAHVSVFLDCYNIFGKFMNGPYWEVAPVGNDVKKCKMNDIKSLLKIINESINEQNEN